MTRIVVVAMIAVALSGTALAQSTPRPVLRTAGPSEVPQAAPTGLYVPPRHPPRVWNPVGGFDGQIHSYGGGINVSSPMPRASVPNW